MLKFFQNSPGLNHFNGLSKPGVMTAFLVVMFRPRFHTGCLAHSLTTLSKKVNHVYAHVSLVITINKEADRLVRNIPSASKSRKYIFKLVSMRLTILTDFIFTKAITSPVNQPEKIDQSHSSLPIKVLAGKKVFCFKS